ncbi:hypothetical protein SAMN05421776_103437 [Nocardia farcinica]|uniref:Uncharacterized protein n=1 Tax=Nocardia farcinica TaxID=37329 RepID=A0A0H5PFF7_NOCFR|nr:hypothetical protein [Nocardia farcinica]AXK87240.1 hypothetical protein DXT66_17845 [Nocardia farcinica]CRY81281.1 Uncharacterised protein [Nocardia farcinica]SIT12265.1 hypothetical protein SAMN05421776_103437 [Nocardia farcinica]
MIRALRIAVVVAALLAVGLYLWHGLTYEPVSRWEPGITAWANGYLALPIVAFVAVTMVFTYTAMAGDLFGGGVLQALTGRNTGAFRAGLTGLGTVKSVRQTGVQVNDQPQVRIEFGVEGADGKVFDATARLVVPLTELALLRPGVVLPVRYLPHRTDTVQVDLSGDTAEAQRVMNQSMIRKGFTTAAKLDIAARGIAAQAVVQSLAVTGRIREGYAEVRIGLAVTRPDGSTFTTRTEKFLPPAGVANVQVGRIVQVHYLPENENEVVLSIPVNA